MMLHSSMVPITAFLLATATAFAPVQFHSRQNRQYPLQSTADDETVDVVVIGAGIGGLSCAGLSAYYGHSTLCVEAHDTAGGVAHSFTRKNKKGLAFEFDSGPSLISGLSSMSTNPLRQVLDALGVEDQITWKTYDGWIIHDTSDQTNFKVTTGDSGAWEDAIEQKAGVAARREFEAFKEEMLTPGGLSESIFDYLLKILSIGGKGSQLTGPFSAILDQHKVNDTFLRKWFDYLAFALSGLDAAHTQAAAILYMMMDLHQPNRILDYPMGGMDSLIQTLVAGLEKHGGRLELNSRVEEIILGEDESGKPSCQGVILANGKRIIARKGVVCNAPLWNMAKILSDSPATSPKVMEAVSGVQKRANDMCMTGSFMHLHLGIPKDGLPEDLECHHSVLGFSKDVTAEQNMVIISIPTVFDPSLAPEGYHIVHAYTAACDNFEQWEKFLQDGETGKVGSSPNSGASKKYASSPEYKALKDEKAEVLWKAIECAIPDVRERAKRDGSIAIVGTPLTHRRYNQRFRGTYGPAPSPGSDVWELAGSKTGIDGLLACGDTTFPGTLMNYGLSHILTFMIGIGLPGVAASGTIAANTLTDVSVQRQLLQKLRTKGALQ